MQLLFELEKEDVNDKKYGWLRKVAITYKSGSSATIWQRKFVGGFSNTIGRCEMVITDVKVSTW